MKASFTPTRTFILGAEGGYSGDPADGGNWTGGRVGFGRLVGSNMGVSAAQLEAYLGRNASIQDMRNLTDIQQAAIFGAEFWNTLNANEVPAGLDLLITDHGYSRGSLTCAMLLQRLVGALPDGHIGEITVATLSAVSPSDLLKQTAMLDVATLQHNLGIKADGVLGPVTASAFGALSQCTALLHAFSAARARDYENLRNPRYQQGWLNRVSSAMTAATALVCT